ERREVVLALRGTVERIDRAAEAVRRDRLANPEVAVRVVGRGEDVGSAAWIGPACQNLAPLEERARPLERSLERRLARLVEERRARERERAVVDEVDGALPGRGPLAEGLEALVGSSWLETGRADPRVLEGKGLRKRS